MLEHSWTLTIHVSQSLPNMPENISLPFDYIPEHHQQELLEKYGSIGKIGFPYQCEDGTTYTLGEIA